MKSQISNLKLQIVFAALVCVTAAAGAYAVWVEYSSFPPHFRGFGEVTRRGEVAGWAVDVTRPGARVEVELYVDGRFVAHGVASLPRPDVVAAGRAQDPDCGYRFPLPALAVGAHEARVYALHAPGGAADRRTLKQLGDPLRFETDAEGRVTSPTR
ncbi:MAG TPA: hypothetical protein VF297_14870 [Pyrinomonadaceae bacterium]